MSKVSPAGHVYGWVPDIPDARDQVWALGAPMQLPASVDLRDECPPVYNQGELGSCTANAIAASLDFTRHEEGEAFIDPSRLFIYWNERDVEGTVSSDSGAQIRDGIKTMKTFGAPPETLWPYDITKFKKKPPVAAYKAAVGFEALTYVRVPQAIISMKQVLAQKRLITIGFSVYASFESTKVAQTGVVPMPSPDEACLGGHAVDVCGYEQLTNLLGPKPGAEYATVRNSWGPDWGDSGYFHMLWEYLTTPSLSSDFWALPTVKKTAA